MPEIDPVSNNYMYIIMIDCIIFWQLNRIFDGLMIMRNFSGYVTLIEEDHFMTPDALYTLDLMITNKQKWVNIFTFFNMVVSCKS